MARRASIYCRISKDRVGAGLGVERQVADCRELAGRLGWEIVSEHSDNDISAYSGKPRPGYKALLDEIRAGAITGILAWHPDRLHRRPVELEEFITLCEHHDVTVQTVRAGEVDLATPSGRAVARTVGAWARHEVEHSIARQQSAKRQAAAAGKYRGGRRPFGYEPDGVTVRASEARLVDEMTHWVLNGQSLHSIAVDLNSAGHTTSTGNPWDARAVRNLVTRPRNAGFVEYNENPEAATAIWKPIVEVNTWRAVRALVDDPARKPKTATRARFLGSGLYRCGVCDDGTTMLSATTRGAGKRHRPAYRCRAGYHLTRMAAPVDEVVSGVVIERLSRPDARLLLAEPTQKTDVVAWQDHANAARARMAEAGLLFGRGKITGEQLEIVTTNAQVDVDEANRALASVITGTALEGFADAEDVAHAWAMATIGRRKAVVDALLTVTLQKAPRGRRPGGVYFDPSCVEIEFRH